MAAVETKSVLLVDDDTANLETLRARLAEEGYQVSCARSGVEAIASVNAHTPDAVVLDHVMPTMSGSTIAALLKGQAATRRIAVVMTSGLPEDMVRPLCNSYDVFLQKPVEFDRLLSTLRRLLH